MKPPAWLTEYEALRSGVGIAELPGRSRVELRGGDRVRFLHSFCTNDIQRLTPGAGCEAFITNHQGKTVGHVIVLCFPDALRLETTAGQAAPLIAHLDRFVISDDVTFQDLTSDYGGLLAAGENAESLLGRLAGGGLPANLWDHWAATIAGHNVEIVRADFLLPKCYFLTVPQVNVDAVQAALLEAGGVRCGDKATDAARLEAGIPIFGRDITADNLPQEIRRDGQAISFTKGCYLGQETIARIDAMGHVNRLLSGVRFLEGAPEAIPSPGTELHSGDKIAGHVTSAAWSPRLGRPLALALVRRAQAAPGTRLESPFGPAEVVSLPLAD